MGDSYSEGLKYVANYKRAKELYRISCDPDQNNRHMTLTQIADLTGLNADAMADMKEEVDREMQEPFQELSGDEIILLTNFRKLSFKEQEAVSRIVKVMASE